MTGPIGTFSTSSELRVVDPVATNIVQGYKNAKGIASFVAPVVPVSIRSGKIKRFGKENFAVMNLKRERRAAVQRVSASFGTANYSVSQIAVGAEVSREDYEDAINGAARVNLRTSSIMRAAKTIEQSWEADVIAEIYDPAKFESNCVINIGGAVSSYDTLIQDAAEVVRSQVGVYPNSAVIAPDVYRFLRRNAEYKDRIKYTSTATVTEMMIAGWWDLLRGVRVARRQKLASDGSLINMVPNGSILLFYNPEGAIDDGFMPATDVDDEEPAFAYSYQLSGYPIAEEERFDANTKCFVTDITIEQSVQVVGLGATDKVGAGCLIQGITG